MKTLTWKHWITFSILSLFLIAFLTLINGPLIAFLGVLLSLFLIRCFLKESLTDYGLHFRKIHIQIISAVVLAFTILFIYHNTSDIWWKFLFFPRSFIVDTSSFLFTFRYFGKTLIHATFEEVLYRGFYLSFFQKLFNNSFVSIFLSAIIFALSHYPLSRNPRQVVFAFFIGLIYGYLRIKDPEKFTLFSLSLAHFLHNIFVI